MREGADVTIIGAGIVGAAVAYRLREKWPDAKIIVLEKEAAPAQHQTGRNSGVIHSGIYYKPGSLKAVLCRTGREMLYDFAQSEEIPHERCGKIILAVEEEELPRLQNLYARGQENQIPGLQLLNSSDIPAYEPHARGWVPSTCR
jgi:L-2-hydroxyglutarate oxidase LhgO